MSADNSVASHDTNLTVGTESAAASWFIAVWAVLWFLSLIFTAPAMTGWQLFDLWLLGGWMACGALLMPSQIRMQRFWLICPVVFTITFIACGGDINGTWLSAMVWTMTITWLAQSTASLNLSTRIGSVLQTLRAGSIFLTLIYIGQWMAGWGHLRGILLHHTGQALIIAMGLAVSLNLPWPVGVPRRMVRVAEWLFLVVGLHWTQSRFGQLAICLCVGLRLWDALSNQRRLRLALAAGVAALGVVLVIHATQQRLSVDPHAESRPRLYEAAILVWLDHPFGVGPGKYSVHAADKAFPVAQIDALSRYGKPPDYPHNLFLECAAEYGVIGLATALFFALLAGWVAYRCRLSEGWIGGAVWAMFWLLLLESMLNISSSLAVIRLPALMLFACAAAPYCAVPSYEFAGKAVRIFLGVVILYFSFRDLDARSIRIAAEELESVGDRVSAEFLFNDLLKSRPWDETAHEHLMVLAARRGDLFTARAHLEPALRRTLHPAVVYRNASVMFAESGDTWASREALESMLAYSSYDASNWLFAAQASADQNLKRRRLTRVLQLEPRAAQAWEEISRFTPPDRVRRYQDLADALRRQYRINILWRLGRGGFEAGFSSARYDLPLLDSRLAESIR